jgi:CheY-like chemotaxis protein
MAKKEKILLVDDDVDLVETLRLILESNGYDVVVANDAAAALERADAERPDLILLDVMMPNATEGFGVLWKLRQNTEQYFREVPVIMATAIQERTGLRFHAEGDLLKAGDSLPAQAFLDKPLDPKLLLQTVQEVLTAAWRERTAHSDRR